MNLFRKTWPLAVALMLVVNGAWIQARRSWAADQPTLALCVPCKVLKVHDGDTATEVEIRVRVQVRYDSCWAPELREPGGPESRDSAKAAEGKTGRLFIPLNSSGNIADLFTFGRVVGTLWLDGATESESQRQVRTGHASTTKGGRVGQ